jgi:hypothetical protein
MPFMVLEGYMWFHEIISNNKKQANNFYGANVFLWHLKIVINMAD